MLTRNIPKVKFYHRINKNILAQAKLRLERESVEMFLIKNKASTSVQIFAQIHPTRSMVVNITDRVVSDFNQCIRQSSNHHSSLALPRQYEATNNRWKRMVCQYGTISILQSHGNRDLFLNQRMNLHSCNALCLPLSPRIYSKRAAFYKEIDQDNKGTIVSGQRDADKKQAEDLLFDMFKNEDTNLLNIGKFLAALRTTGIRRTDPRIGEMMENLKKVHKLNNYDGGSPLTQHLNAETFKAVISPNIVLIARAFRHQFVIPDFHGFTKDIEELYWKCKSNTDGKVASYIPQLARVNPDYWGISICTVDGQRFSIGDSNVSFTLQSCSKPLTYAIALEKLGSDVVHQYVGQEPSGRNFNELVLDYNKKPHNPMINAGSILTCSLLKTLVHPEMTLAEKFDYTQTWFSRMAGGETLGFNNAVFLSEREAADRNYALGFYMREHKCYPEKANLRECMDFYFQCCSMETTCETLSIVASTLANGGICPLTEEKVLKSENVRDVLSLMHSCGMYDFSGQFAFKVGLPAKSGVCGGVMLVIPNVMGIFMWSPPLDPLGNSCRGVQFCEELVNIFNFHLYDNLKHGSNKKDPRRHRYETKGLSVVNLLFSAASGDVTALRRHKLSGMDITLSDYDGRTALHLACSEGHLECVKFLLEHCGVPHDARDRWGNRPIDEAETFGHDAVVDFLKEWDEKVEMAKKIANDPGYNSDRDSSKSESSACSTDSKAKHPTDILN
ncbi:glutaminase liver isoform, mitochondrial isoform X2 [Malaya genurostris]|uniref:glutaminase liver isoform, mitochondrial isoform X2 n=1 Tax=Malaya genurostris TaxID=325434 RepID=UPI0026F3BF3B|nr:glutaminase liver isoform, mitochondrial isoform X2 [Malaya genurostris]